MDLLFVRPMDIDPLGPFSRARRASFLSSSRGFSLTLIYLYNFNLFPLRDWFRVWLVGGFMFLFSKQYKNNFQKIELETSFQIIIFYILRVWLLFLRTIFKILKAKKNCLGDHFYFWDLKKKKNLQKKCAESVDYFFFFFNG